MKMDYESIAIDHSAIDAETEFEPYLENSSKPPFIIPKEFSNFTISKNVCNRKKKKKAKKEKKEKRDGIGGIRTHVHNFYVNSERSQKHFEIHVFTKNQNVLILFYLANLAAFSITSSIPPTK